MTLGSGDLLIRGGTVVDGTGGPPADADVLVRAGRIVAVGDVDDDGGEADDVEVLDAGGLVVCPGFVDVHSHADYTLPNWPRADSCLFQGVTTLLAGNCGFSPFPIVGDPGPLRRHGGFFGQELTWDWRDLDSYAGALEQLGLAVNVGLQVGHGALRIAAMGFDERAPSGAELDRMAGLLAEAAEQGALGFSTGLVYAPGAYADREEVALLARVAAEHGLLYSTHMRNESEHLGDSVDETIDTARRSGVRLEISHLKAMGPAYHGSIGAALSRIDEARDAGVDVTADVYPYTASSTTLTSRLPTWALDGGPDALLARLEDPAERARVADGVRARFGREVHPEGVVLSEVGEGAFRGFIGRSLTDVARHLDVDPAMAAVEVLRAHQGSVGIVNHALDEADVTTVLRHPCVSVASDGWELRPEGPGRPHPRSFGTFVRVLRRYVREQGVLSLPEAIRKMTSLPASRVGLTNRGVVRSDAVADLVVLDADTVADTSTFDDPWQLATGVRHVLVAGEPVLRDGALTQARPGRVLGREPR